MEIMNSVIVLLPLLIPIIGAFVPIPTVGMTGVSITEYDVVESAGERVTVCSESLSVTPVILPR
jgi:hypothetical protein